MRIKGYMTLLQNHRLRRCRGRALVALLLLACIVLVASHSTTAQPQAKPAGEMRWALYVTLAPSWFDPGEVVGLITPFGPLYQYIWPSGIGPRVEEPALMLIDPYPWSAPLEEVRLKPE